VTARRLHNGNRSGWWKIAVWPVGILAVANVVTAPITRMVVGGIAFAVVLIALLVWLVSRGTKGQNRFGAGSLAQTEAKTSAFRLSSLMCFLTGPIPQSAQ
jgi:uncharacterized membrane protein YhaH (DUF805 family)